MSSNDWPPADHYPAILEREGGVLIYSFPDLPEINGSMAGDQHHVELGEALARALFQRKARKHLMPFPSRVEGLKGQVVLIDTPPGWERLEPVEAE